MSSVLSLTPPRSHTRITSTSSRPGSTLRLAPLRAPLVVKLIGANLAVVAMLVGAWLWSGHPVSLVGGIVIIVAIAVYTLLVLIALRPIRDLDAVASRVWNGDYAARVTQSAVADQGAVRVGSMFNILLDSLADDRQRMRALASEVIAAGETERAALARELHDSTAQRLAGLLLQLSAAARDSKDATLTPRLIAARDATEEIVEEVRVLSHTLRPIVLDELGLVPALEKLARDSTTGTGIDVDVHAEATPRSISRTVASALYRVAQEAVRNSVLHASASKIHIVLRGDSRSASLEVLDDGIGFDPAGVESTETTLKRGLASMRERVALVDGGLEIKSAPGGGTTIVVTVPLSPAA